MSSKRHLKLRFRDLLEGQCYHCSENLFLDQLVQLGSIGFIASQSGMRRAPTILGNRWQVEVHPGDYIVQYAGVEKIAAENRKSEAESFIRVRIYAVIAVDTENRIIECEIPEIVPGFLKFESGRMVKASWEEAEEPEEVAE